MKKFIKELILSTIPFILIFGAMYLAKLCELLFNNVPIPILILGFLIIIYKILKEVLL